ncbi:MAG: hypothetical protein RL030_2149 [Pseudomonadota bacterium]
MQYVDSGSTDGSVREARSRGVEVVNLDLSIPFTAARARNAGAFALAKRFPDLRYVQFVDGDCELHPDWIDEAVSFLESHADVAVVFGTQKEREPEATVYNSLMEIEWDTPLGYCNSCAGNSMFRWEVFSKVGGFRDTLIAGEEPELCVRVRRTGAKVFHLDAPMAVHDADVTRFGQWWRRTLRAGHAFAEGAALHGDSPDRHFAREARSDVFWALLLPLLILVLAVGHSPWWLLMLLAYPVQVLRVAVRGRWGMRRNMLNAGFIVLAKFPSLIGALTYHWRTRTHKTPRLIEYK